MAGRGVRFSLEVPFYREIAQLVEQRTENSRVIGSIPILSAIFHLSARVRVVNCSSLQNCIGLVQIQPGGPFNKIVTR